MPKVTTTDSHIKEVYELLNSYRPSKTKAVERLDAAVNGLVEDKLWYQTNIDTLYSQRSIIKKILYFFGFFISSEEKSQMSCIRRINKAVDFVQTKKDTYKPSASELAKASLRSQYTELLNEKDFRELLAFSLKADPSEREIKEILAKNSGALFYVADLYFANVISDFLKKTNLTQEDKAKGERLLKAFTFNQNVQWKSVKQQSEVIFTSPSYRAKAVERLHTSIRTMKPGDEVVFSGSSKVPEKESYHAVLFSCKKIEDDTFCVRVYNTSDVGSMSGSLGGILRTGWGILRGHDAEISARRNFKITVNQAFFQEWSLLSTQFAGIFTEEILVFGGMDKGTNKELFAHYKKFVEESQISPRLANKPEAPQIKFQQGPNCAISSKLAYIEETLGSELFARFASFVTNTLP